MVLDFYIDKKYIIFDRLFRGPILGEHIKELNNLVTYNKIKFGHEFNSSIDKLPKNIKVILLGDLFNKPVDNLNTGLEKLHFGEYFNNELNNLPITLRSLHLGLYFNKPLDYLPNSLEKLSFSQGSRYCGNFDNLPNSLIYLEIPILYPNMIDNLPESIEFLLIGVKFNKKKYDFFDKFEKINNKKVNYYKNELINIVDNKYNKMYYFIEGCEEMLENIRFNKKINKYPNSLKRMYIYSEYEYIDDLKIILKEKLIVIYNHRDFY